MAQCGESRDVVKEGHVMNSYKQIDSMSYEIPSIYSQDKPRNIDLIFVNEFDCDSNGEVKYISELDIIQ